MTMQLDPADRTLLSNASGKSQEVQEAMATVQLQLQWRTAGSAGLPN